MAEQENLAFLVAQERQSRALACETADVSLRNAHIAMADDYARRIVATSIVIPI